MPYPGFFLDEPVVYVVWNAFLDQRKLPGAFLVHFLHVISAILSIIKLVVFAFAYIMSNASFSFYKKMSPKNPKTLQKC